MRRLVRESSSVRCLVRNPARLARLSGVSIEVARGDLDDGESLRRAAESCESCIHLAATSAWHALGSDHLARTIVDGTARLVEALSAAGVRRLVHVSSIAAVNGSSTPVVHDERSRFELEDSGLAYALAKHRAEEIVLARAGTPLEVVIVNPAETYGPDDFDWVTAGNVRNALRGWFAFAVAGGTAIAHVDDVAAGVIAALRHGRGGERYILGGDNVGIDELIRLVRRLGGRRGGVVALPRAGLRLAVTACRALGLTPPLEPALVDYACRYWFMSSAKAVRELGYRARPVEAVMAPVVAWVMTQQPAPSLMETGGMTGI